MTVNRNSSLVESDDKANMTGSGNETRSDGQPEEVKTKVVELQEAKAGYEDEAEVFYKDPVGFLRGRFPATVDRGYPPTDKSVESYQWPSHLVLFEVLWSHSPVRDILLNRGYRVVWNATNGRWHDDPLRRGGNVLVLQSNSL